MAEQKKVTLFDWLILGVLFCLLLAASVSFRHRFLTHELMTWRHDRIQAIAADSALNKTVIDTYDSCWKDSLFPQKDGCITDAVIAGRDAGASDTELTEIFKRFPIVGEPDYCHDNSYGCTPMWIGAQDPRKNTKLFNNLITLMYPEQASGSSIATKTEAEAPVQ